MRGRALSILGFIVENIGSFASVSVVVFVFFLFHSLWCIFFGWCYCCDFDLSLLLSVYVIFFLGIFGRFLFFFVQSLFFMSDRFDLSVSACRILEFVSCILLVIFIDFRHVVVMFCFVSHRFLCVFC